ncbi:hypothetical protein MKW92_039936 [Papaver armeniacum]|nr:hypothetical protein MKW92_039936 [Papaver armeniacum]
MDFTGPIHDFQLVFFGIGSCLIVGGLGAVLLTNTLFSSLFIGIEYYNDFSLWTIGDGVTSLVCTNIFVSLITTIPDTSWYGVIWTTRSNHILEQDLINKGQLIGIHLSTNFFLHFELISIILLVSLIGVIAMARQ